MHLVLPLTLDFYLCLFFHYNVSRYLNFSGQCRFHSWQLLEFPSQKRKGYWKSSNLVIKISQMIKDHPLVHNAPKWSAFAARFLGGVPTSICHSFRPSVRPSIRLSVRRAPCLRNLTSCDNNFWYTCVKLYLQEFLLF